MTVQRDGFKWLVGAGLALCATGCMLSFEAYPEADLCAAGLDAGLAGKAAPDPVLRGCDAGTQAADEDASLGQAGATAMDGGQ